MRKRTCRVTIFGALSALVFAACSESSNINAPYQQDDLQGILSELNPDPTTHSSSSKNQGYSSAKQNNKSSSSSRVEQSSSSQNPQSSSSQNSLYSSSSSKQSNNPWNQWQYPWGQGNQNSSSSSNSQSSSSSNWGNTNSSAIVTTNLQCSDIRKTTDKFSKLNDILACVEPGEKVAFVIRHAARNKSASGDNGTLNDEGRAQSVAFGKELANVGDIYFMNTKVYRTMETVLKIVEGKGQNFSEKNYPFSSKVGNDHEESEDLEDKFLVKNENTLNNSCRPALQSKFNWSWGWSPYSYVAYEENVIQECKDAFYDVDDKLAELVQNHFTYDKMHDITLAISHDKLLVPLVIAASNRKIDLRFHQHENDFNYWINYLTGIAIIVDKSNNTTILPTTALNDPFLRTFPDN